MTFQLAQVRHLILDMDGVLWQGETPLPQLPAFFAALESLGIGVALATNNATKTPESYVARLAGMGVRLTAQQVVGAAEATASYIQRFYPAGATVFVVGEAGLHEMLRRYGLTIVNPLDAAYTWAGRPADLVVVGLDRQVTYQQLADAARHLERGAVFIGANPDTSLPTEDGALPGAGALLAALEATTGRSPLIIGKPRPGLFDEALRRLGGKPHDTAMVGDRLETDIAGAQQAGLPAILVLTGVTRPADLAASPIQPDAVYPDIHALAAALRQAHRVG